MPLSPRVDPGKRRVSCKKTIVSTPLLQWPKVTHLGLYDGLQDVMCLVGVDGDRLLIETGVIVITVLLLGSYLKRVTPTPEKTDQEQLQEYQSLSWTVSCKEIGYKHSTYLIQDTILYPPITLNPRRWSNKTFFTLVLSYGVVICKRSLYYGNWVATSTTTLSYPPTLHPLSPQKEIRIPTTLHVERVTSPPTFIPVVDRHSTYCSPTRSFPS